MRATCPARLLGSLMKTANQRKDVYMAFLVAVKCLPSTDKPTWSAAVK